MKLETKFSIGDVVWNASTTRVSKRHPCPDCKDTRKWKAVSPAGGEYSIPCPRCRTQYRSDDKLSLDYAEFGPAAQCLTIGSVRLDTAPHSNDDPVSYMCHETGVGSGTIYRESRLHSSQAKAMAAATLLATDQNKTTPWVAEIYDRTLSLSDYQFDNALAKAGRDQLIKTNTDVQMLFEDLRDCEDMDAIRARLEEGFRPRAEVDPLADPAQVEADLMGGVI